ncbi:carboxymuconolactone decarboxylase family protein [Novosphingobium sp. TH158]|uniref:carboxymuconolactone decarboxylase family protein n=1 Tax=Novosphingobium sp. TH158 TaxID=2067455 RepID=UPI000C7D2E31|nr:carboxymuconolactone decarboxylase family protein [Novosphingobium sp. TH158]PLK26790.1 carboxymuconolactone decarboxylase [Novosphingobium sp. TH158]
MTDDANASGSALPQDPAPRLPPVRPDDFTDEMRAFFGKWTGGFFSNADKNPPLMTFAHHPRLADVFSQFNIHLLTTNTLPVKQRQIAIMRTAWVTKATYMWSSHLKTSRLAGLSDDMYAPIQNGADDPYFTPFESAVIRATDELVLDHEVSDASWEALMTEWNKQQMLDFLFTVGGYVLSAGVMRSARIQRQPDLLALAERYGAP